MPRWMPILRQHDVFKVFRQLVDNRHDLITARYGKRAAGAEIVLYVNHDEDVTVADRVSLGQFLPPWSFCRPLQPAAKLNVGECGCQPLLQA